jgi:eukaryotic-like serine/threonine-protein kinase
VFKFITHRPLWVNILAALVLAFLVFMLFMFSLKCLTNHGRSRTVPPVVGKLYSEGDKILTDGGFTSVVQDSVYIDSLPPLTITKQLPEADAVVKVNRTVYLTINRASAPFIELPSLIGFSYRNAAMTLDGVGLKIKDTIHRPDFAGGSVLDVLYNGASIPPGTKLQMGSAVVLAISSGVGESYFNVPDLFGRTYSEAKNILESHGINMLVLSAPGVTDSLNAFIVRQEPQRYDEFGKSILIRTGQIISVVLGVDKPVRDTLPNPLPADQIPQQN